jgi:hypothetical protein
LHTVYQSKGSDRSENEDELSQLQTTTSWSQSQKAAADASGNSRGAGHGSGGNHGTAGGDHTEDTLIPLKTRSTNPFDEEDEAGVDTSLVDRDAVSVRGEGKRVSAEIAVENTGENTAATVSDAGDNAGTDGTLHATNSHQSDSGNTDWTREANADLELSVHPPLASALQESCTRKDLLVVDLGAAKGEGAEKSEDLKEKTQKESVVKEVHKTVGSLTVSATQPLPSACQGAARVASTPPATQERKPSVDISPVPSGNGGGAVSPRRGRFRSPPPPPAS